MNDESVKMKAIAVHFSISYTLLSLGALFCLGQFECIPMTIVGFFMLILGMLYMMSIRGKKRMIRYYFK